MEFSQNLKVLRQKSGLSQTELAQKLTVSRKTISAWENDRSTPGLDDLNNICHLFDISSEELIYASSEKIGNQVQTISKKTLQTKLKIPAFVEIVLFIIVFIGIPHIIVMNILVFLLLILTLYLSRHSTKFLLPGERRSFYKKRRKFIIIYSLYLVVLITTACFITIEYFDFSASFILGLAYGAFGSALIMLFASMVIYNLLQLYDTHPVRKFKKLVKRKTQS